MPSISFAFGPEAVVAVGGVKSTPNVARVGVVAQLPSASQTFRRRSYATEPVAAGVSARLVTLVNVAHAVELAEVPCGAHCVLRTTLSTPPPPVLLGEIAVIATWLSAVALPPVNEPAATLKMKFLPTQPFAVFCVPATYVGAVVVMSGARLSRRMKFRLEAFNVGPGLPLLSTVVTCTPSVSTTAPPTPPVAEVDSGK